MTDRNVQYPNRFHVTPVPGTDDICEIIPAPGTVYAEGTFWNKQNVLKDATAALYGKDAAAVPDDIFAAIKPLISAVDGKIKIASGSYAGTGTQKTITFNFEPKFFFCTSDANAVGEYETSTGITAFYSGGPVWRANHFNVSSAHGIRWTICGSRSGNSLVLDYIVNMSTVNYYYIAIG